jgi:hypothetical protein
MGDFAMRPDGLADVSLPDGSVMPMALSPQQLTSMGHQQVPTIRLPPPGQPTVGGGVPFAQGVSDPMAGAPRIRLGGDSPARAALDRMAVAQSSDRALTQSMTPAELAAHNEAIQTGAAQSPALVSAAEKQNASRGAVKKGSAVAGGVDLAAHAEPREGVAQPSAPGYGALTPEDELIFKEGIGGGGQGKTVPYLKEEKAKYTQMGQVPGEVSADIAQKQSALDETQEADLSQHHYEESQYEQQRQRQLEQQQRDIQDQRAQREEVNARLQSLQQVRDQREQAVQDMKPPEMADYFGNNSTFSNVMTGVSIALGGALQGLRGGANPGLEMANQSIDRWINEQKEAYSRKRQGVEMANNQYADALKLYGTPEMAENDMRARAYAARDALMKNQLDQIGTEDAFAKGNEILQQGQLQRQQLKAQAYQLAGEKAMEDTIGTRVQGGAGGRYLKGLEAVAKGRELQRTIYGDAGKGQETRVVLPDGQVGYAASSSEAEKLRGQVEGADNVAGLARSIKKKIETLGGRVDPETRGKVLAEIGKLKIQLTKQDAVPLRGATEILDQMVGDPEATFNLRTNPGARLDAIAADAEHSVHSIQRFHLTSRPVGSGPAAAGQSAAPATSERQEEE